VVKQYDLRFSRVIILEGKMTYVPIPLPNRVKIEKNKALKVVHDYYIHMCKRHSVRNFSKEPVSTEIIEKIIETAGRAPSGANQQPWHFVAIKDQEKKAKVRSAAENEEKAFYSGRGHDEWISALEPIGTDASKPHLTDAPWLIIIFAERYGFNKDGSRRKNYYVNESVGIATGFLISAIHNAGLVCLTHTPNPMKFLNSMCVRPINEKPIMILPVGYASPEATIPVASTNKKSLNEIMSIF
tara:strand:- start:299 stop:1024 length:726 start_codon:yes stop_codon:yes gene_type:complete